MSTTPIEVYVKVGRTEPVVVQCYLDDAVNDLTGVTPTLEVTDKNGNDVALTGAVAFNDAATGKVQYTPDGQLVKELSPYAVRVILTSGAAVDHSPNGQKFDRWWIVDP